MEADSSPATASKKRSFDVAKSPPKASLPLMIMGRDQPTSQASPQFSRKVRKQEQHVRIPLPLPCCLLISFHNMKLSQKMPQGLRW